MDSYGKVWVSIYNGTLMSQAGWLGVYVFSSMIILADKDGIVDMDEMALYRTLGLEEDDSGVTSFSRFKEVINELCLPDPLSNIKKMDGKRLIPLSELPDIPNNRGWFIVNYDEYRKRGTAHERNEYARGYMAAMRKIANESKQVSKSKQTLKTVSKVRHTDTDTDTDIVPKGTTEVGPSGGDEQEKGNTPFRLLSAFADKYQSVTGNKYVKTDKDMAHTKRLLKTLPHEDITGRFDPFFNDVWVKERGAFDFATFASMVNRFTTQKPVKKLEFQPEIVPPLMRREENEPPY